MPFIIFFWGGGGWGQVVAMFLDGSFFKTHLVTLCISAKLKQIFGYTTQTHD